MARATTRTSTRKRSQSRKGSGKIGKVLGEYKRGSLRSSSGSKVRKREQAVAIALNEARQSGARIPRRPRGRSHKAKSS